MNELDLKSPLFTVVIPVYNAEKFLADTIQSVLDQTRPDFELLLIDDKSSDRSVAIAEKFSARDSRIRLLQMSEASRGMPGEVRNFGLKNAKGEWIAFLDSDDIWLPGKLEAIHSKAKRFPNAN